MAAPVQLAPPPCQSWLPAPDQSYQASTEQRAGFTQLADVVVARTRKRGAGLGLLEYGDELGEAESPRRRGTY